MLCSDMAPASAPAPAMRQLIKSNQLMLPPWQRHDTQLSAHWNCLLLLPVGLPVACARVVASQEQQLVQNVTFAQNYANLMCVLVSQSNAFASASAGSSACGVPCVCLCVGLCVCVCTTCQALSKQLDSRESAGQTHNTQHTHTQARNS